MVNSIGEAIGTGIGLGVGLGVAGMMLCGVKDLTKIGKESNVKYVYAYNQEQAKAECRARYLELVPYKVKYAGTKHGFKVYACYCKKRKK